MCSASVFFLDEKPHPSISVNCSGSKVQKQAIDDDYEFYQKMKARTSPLTGENIPGEGLVFVILVLNRNSSVLHSSSMH